jgi:hypothetical protein
MNGMGGDRPGKGSRKPGDAYENVSVAFFDDLPDEGRCPVG